MHVLRPLIPLIAVLLGCGHVTKPARDPVEASVSATRMPMQIAFPCADLAECTLACDAGDANACVRAADETTVSLMKVPAYARACRDGAELGCVRLAREYFERRALGRNADRANDLIRVGCDRDPDSCLEAARTLRDFDAPLAEVQSVAQRGWAVARKGCSSGNFVESTKCLVRAPAFTEVGLDDPSFSSDIDRARTTLEASCREGRLQRCFYAALAWASPSLPTRDVARGEALAAQAGRNMARGCAPGKVAPECESPENIARPVDLSKDEELDSASRLESVARRAACDSGDKATCEDIAHSDRWDACFDCNDGAVCLELAREWERLARESEESRGSLMESAFEAYQRACRSEIEAACVRLKELKTKQ